MAGTRYPRFVRFFRWVPSGTPAPVPTPSTGNDAGAGLTLGGNVRSWEHAKREIKAGRQPSRVEDLPHDPYWDRDKNPWRGKRKVVIPTAILKLKAPEESSAAVAGPPIARVRVPVRVVVPAAVFDVEYTAFAPSASRPALEVVTPPSAHDNARLRRNRVSQWSVIAEELTGMGIQ